MDISDRSNGIRYHTFDTRPDTEFDPGVPAQLHSSPAQVPSIAQHSHPRSVRRHIYGTTRRMRGRACIANTKANPSGFRDPSNILGGFTAGASRIGESV
jgi:hypothetical protein